MMKTVMRRSAGPGMPPEEIRAAREVNGWSAEEFADVLWVTPLEVQAWEAGAVTPAVEEARWIRWHAEMGARDRALADAGLRPCAWVQQRRALYPVDRRGSHPSDFVGREIELHVTQCPACGALPMAELRRVPMPEPPRQEREGWADWFVRHWRAAEHLPLGQRFGVRVLVPAGLLAAGMLMLGPSWVEAGEVSLPWIGFLTWFAGYHAFLVGGPPLRGVADEHPWLVWQARTAAVLYSMLVVYGSAAESLALDDPGVWVMTGFFSLIIGGVAGAIAADSLKEDEYLKKCVALTLAPAPAPGESLEKPEPQPSSSVMPSC
jgi:hypothetical protein